MSFPLMNKALKTLHENSKGSCVCAHPLSSVTRTLIPEKSIRDWLPPEWEGGAIWMERWLDGSGIFSLTIKVTIDPFPTPSLSIHIWPSIRLTNLFHHTDLVRILCNCNFTPKETVKIVNRARLRKSGDKLLLWPIRDPTWRRQLIWKPVLLMKLASGRAVQLNRLK